jgi:hypothetical protein
MPGGQQIGKNDPGKVELMKSLEKMIWQLQS